MRHTALGLVSGQVNVPAATMELGAASGGGRGMRVLYSTDDEFKNLNSIDPHILVSNANETSASPPPPSTMAVSGAESDATERKRLQQQRSLLDGGGGKSSDEANKQQRKDLHMPHIGEGVSSGPNLIGEHTILHANTHPDLIRHSLTGGSTYYRTRSGSDPNLIQQIQKNQNNNNSSVLPGIQPKCFVFFLVQFFFCLFFFCLGVYFLG